MIVGGIPTPLLKGDSLPAGAVVITSASDSVNFSVGSAGKLISVGPNSQVRLKDSDKLLILDRGEIVGSVRASKGKSDADELTIQSPLGTTRVGAADFSVNTYDNSLNVLSGRQVTHEPVLRAADSRAGQSAMTVAPGTGLSMNGPNLSVTQLGNSANASLMQKVDRLVTATSQGAPTARAAASGGTISPEPYPNPGTGTPGYWKTHASAWPYSSISIGGKTYTVTEAINYMNLSSSKKDRTYTMFQDLVCAQLNVTIGNDPSCIASMITKANNWMAAHPVGSRVGGSSTAWAEGDPIHQQLDSYNNGLLCAPHRT